MQCFAGQEWKKSLWGTPAAASPQERGKTLFNSSQRLVRARDQIVVLPVSPPGTLQGLEGPQAG